MIPAVLLGMIRGSDAIARALLERADLKFVALHDATARVLTEAGIAHTRLDDLLTPEMREHAVSEAEARLAAIVHALSEPSFRRAWPEFSDTAWATTRARLLKALQRDLIEQIVLVDLVRRCASESNLRLVLVPEDTGRDPKTAIRAAQRLGIPALHVLHGFPYGTQHGHEAVVADMMAVYSDAAKSVFLPYVDDPNRIRVTGNPDWDVYARPPRTGLKEEVCARMGLDPRLPTVALGLTRCSGISVATLGNLEYGLRTAEAALNACARLKQRYPDWQFIIRPHPGGWRGLEGLLEHAQKLGLPPLYVDFAPPHECLAASDVLVCIESNLGIEAILWGKPVVNIVLDTVPAEVFEEGLGPLFTDADAVLIARSESQIEAAIESALTDPATKRRLIEAQPMCLRRFNGVHDGGAMARVRALAQDMIERGEQYRAWGTRREAL